MAVNTASRETRAFVSLGLMVMLCLFVMPTFADPLLNGGAIGGGSSGSNGSSAAMATAIGNLFESLVTIFGIYYTLKSMLIYARVVSGRGAGQQDNMGSVLSHFAAGVIAYYSRVFFAIVHNTVPMIPDFGRLVYDAELMLGLMS